VPTSLLAAGDLALRLLWGQWLAVVLVRAAVVAVLAVTRGAPGPGPGQLAVAAVWALALAGVSGVWLAVRRRV